MLEVVDIPTERVDRFEMFYQTLSKEERCEIDVMIHYVCEVMRRGNRHFGSKMAIELVMALVDFVDKHPLKGG